jgi:7-alpha-hydroxysteroid dehydrogenase
MLENFRVDGKVAIVAGAGRGIGAASAIALAEAGADVTVLARNAAQLDEVAEQIRSFGRKALAIPTDLHDSAALEAAVSRTASELGRIDILVNVVGGAMPAPYVSTSAADVRNAFEHNVVVLHRAIELVVPHLLAVGGGTIINISSIIAQIKGRGFLAYGTSKAALDHYTHLLSLDLSPRIRVNAIAPGAILTDALASIMTDPTIKHMLESKTPLGRIGMPEDIANAVVYLASPAASYVTGQVLAVSGGVVTPNFEMPIPDL